MVNPTFSFLFWANPYTKVQTQFLLNLRNLLLKIFSQLVDSGFLNFVVGLRRPPDPLSFFFFSFTCLLRLSPSYVLVFFGFLNFVVGFLFGLDLDLSLAYGSGRRVLQRLRTASAPQRLCVFGIGGALADKVFQLDAYRVECWSMVTARFLSFLSLLPAGDLWWARVSVTVLGLPDSGMLSKRFWSSRMVLWTLPV
ncbi:unnamed protein product [Brassica napus]|uniref:(rape) hypothetical protein n=1 Tax=Brassica napus TaxID=3708 RepID=A0A816VTK5_BRANA|nr:unnamed protein product [Brassica napus]